MVEELTRNQKSNVYLTNEKAIVMTYHHCLGFKLDSFSNAFICIVLKN